MKNAFNRIYSSIKIVDLRMDDNSNNYNEQPTLTQVQNATITFPVFISVVGIISVALAVMLYHLILLRYCRHQHYSDQPAISSTPAPHLNETSLAVPVSWFGLDDRALEAIPVLPYCEPALDFFRIDQSECVVCLGKLQRGERVRWLPGCSHAFHMACIDSWLRARASCPTCRAPVVVPPPLLRQLLGGAPYVNGGGGMTRARSGGALVRDAKDSGGSLSIGMKRSLSMDHSCVIDVSSPGSNSRVMAWRATGLMKSILGLKVQDGDATVLPY